MINLLLTTLTILGWATTIALATAVVLAIRWTWQDTQRLRGDRKAGGTNDTPKP